MSYFIKMELELVGVNNGRYNVFVIKNDEYIGPVITQGHEWDGWMRNEVKKYYKAGTDILDIGANIGYNTLIFSDYGPVHSFEPVFHQIINQTCKSNNLKNKVSVYPCALSDKQEMKEIYIPAHGCQSNVNINYGGTSFHPSESMKGAGITVQCAKLDDIYDGVPSLIKIDVEGHELQVLEGAKETIKKHKPTLLVEIHDFENNPVVQLISELGYGTPESKPEGMFLYRANDIFSTM